MCSGLGKWHPQGEMDLKAKAAVGFIPILNICVNARAGGGSRAGTVQWADISVQWNNCWGIELEGVCCLDIFVREILARERLTAHSLWKEMLPLNIWGRRMIGTASLIAKHLLYRIFSKIHGYITLNCSVVHKLYDSKVNKGVEWKAAIPNIPTMEREQAIIQYRKSLTYENCWTPKAEGTVQGSLISWAFYLKKVLILY